MVTTVSKQFLEDLVDTSRLNKVDFLVFWNQEVHYKSIRELHLGWDLQKYRIKSDSSWQQQFGKKSE
jgi:hypothetical protein